LYTIVKSLWIFFELLSIENNPVFETELPILKAFRDILSRTNIEFCSLSAFSGEWRKLHNEELHDFYSSPSIIRIIRARRMKWAWHVALMWEKRNAYRLLVGKPEGRRPLGRPRRRWLDNIRMDLVEVGWSDVDWIGLAQDRGRWRTLVNSVLNLRVP
jgi:sugar phosphate isomerase/epimerase